MNAADKQIKDWHEEEMQQVFEEECCAASSVTHNAGINGR